MSELVTEFNQEFNHSGVKSCEINGMKHVAIVKFIASVTSMNNSSAKKYWNDMKVEYPKLMHDCRSYKFPGCIETQVGDAKVLLQIVAKLPGKHAKRFRETSDAAFDFLLTSQKQSREYEETLFYVRIQLPSSYIVSATNIKQLTLNIIKLGIAYSINDRNRGYMKDPDNGYMAFTFACCSRQEAIIVENIMKYEYEALTILGSSEYLDAHRLAVSLGVEYTAGTYGDYIKVARALFVHMVETVKLLFPDKYRNLYGTMYSITEKLNTCVGYQKYTSSLNFPGRIITQEFAADFGFRNPSTQWIPIQPKEPVLSDPAVHTHFMQNVQDASTLSTTPRSLNVFRETRIDNRSNGKIISRDLVTGNEVPYGSVQEAGDSIGYTARSMQDFVVNAPRHLAGKIWRTPGSPYWMPPQGLQMDITERTGVINYVRSTDSEGNKKVYDNPTIAARATMCIARPLQDAIRSGKKIGGLFWAKVPKEETQLFSDSPVDTSSHVTLITLPQSADGRSRGKVIQTDILTGEEVVHNSASAAAKAQCIIYPSSGKMGHLHRMSYVSPSIFTVFFQSFLVGRG